MTTLAQLKKIKPWFGTKSHIATPFGLAETEAILGDPSQYVTEFGQEQGKHQWELDKIISVKIPFKLPIGFLPGKYRKTLKVHKVLADEVVSIMENLHRDGFTADDLVFDGDFVFRRKRGGRRLSMHAFGGAFDFNAQKYPMLKRGQTGPEQDARLIRIFEEYGWNYGGFSYEEDTFAFDPQHFQKPYDC